MHALIDADIFCYEIGCMKNPDTGVPLPWPIIKRLLDDKLWDIQQKTGAESWQGYLTGTGNFRFEVATIQPYKSGRGEKPFWFQAIRNYLRDNRNCVIVDGYEADDAIAIAADRETTVICSRDKDLRQVPGYHYTWSAGKQKEQTIFWISELEGARNFYSQCLTGDPVDSIPGLYMVGGKSASVQRVQQAETELECFNAVKQEYKNRFGSYWKMFLRENGTLLWLLRSEDDNWGDRMELLDQQSEALKNDAE
jgi:hypothetical protein